MQRAIIILLVLGAAGTAAAQSDNKALAEQLFAQGKELSKAGDWAAACPKFEASLRYDPALGTRLNLATCYEKVGKIASAWALYKESADLARKAGDDKRRAFAAKQVSSLEPRLPRLSVTATATPGLTVTRNGTTIDAVLFGTPAFVDPGEYEIVASAPGFEPYSTKVMASEWNLTEVTVPALTPARPAPDDGDGDGDGKAGGDRIGGDGPPAGDEGPIREPAGPAPSRARARIGMATAGVGIVLVGVGLYFGNSARGSYADAKDACGGDLNCDNADDLARSEALVEDARGAALTSTVLTGVGAAAIVGGAIMWLTAPKAGDRPRTSWRVGPTVGPGRAALVFGGSF